MGHRDGSTTDRRLSQAARSRPHVACLPSNPPPSQHERIRDSFDRHQHPPMNLLRLLLARLAIRYFRCHLPAGRHGTRIRLARRAYRTHDAGAAMVTCVEYSLGRPQLHRSSCLPPDRTRVSEVINPCDAGYVSRKIARTLGKVGLIAGKYATQTSHAGRSPECSVRELNTPQ